MSDAPSRYRDAAIIGDGTNLYFGRRTIGNTLPRGDDRFATVRMVDNLHLIAFRAFGDERLWWVVADFNDILDPMADLVPGTVLRVPSMTRLWLEVLA